uniref:Solute carrier family 2, facilitated glucose transporter member 4 n=1 Tax=Melopsittacus undulatus TaxID=13146 RepID=A0A8V5GNE6_MELUD
MGGAELGPTYALVVIGRLVTGLHSGLASGLVPLYVEEVAPPPLQGALSAAHEAGFALGLLTSQVLALPPLLGSVRSLPALLALGMLPAALQLLLLPMGPGGAHGACAGPAPRLGLPQLWGRGQLRQPMAIVVGAALGKELAGIGALYYYSTAIFERAGLPQPTWATVATGVINMAATLAAVSPAPFPPCPAPFGAVSQWERGWCDTWSSRPAGGAVAQGGAQGAAHGGAAGHGPELGGDDNGDEHEGPMAAAPHPGYGGGSAPGLLLRYGARAHPKAAPNGADPDPSACGCCWCHCSHGLGWQWGCGGCCAPYGALPWSVPVPPLWGPCGCFCPWGVPVPA